MDVWIDLFHSVRGLDPNTLVLLTDNAVGQAEEENLQHLQANLAEAVDPSRIVPFLTTKHTLEYCLMYAARANAQGVEALTVVGGDHGVGAERCVPHGADLREKVRARVPGLALGSWTNPHRDPVRQLDYLEAGRAEADFTLTQIVSHHDLPAIEGWLTEAQRRRLEAHPVFGVFFYHNADPRVLARLAGYFPAPVDDIAREFGAGASGEEICGRSIRALRELGIERIYLSNLGSRRPASRLARILDAAHG